MLRLSAQGDNEVETQVWELRNTPEKFEIVVFTHKTAFFMVKSKCFQLYKSTIPDNDTPPALTSVTQNMTP